MSELLTCPACGRPVSPEDRFCPGCGVSLGGAPPPDDADLAARLHDALAPSYLLVRRLGAGGMGAVFLAREPALKRLVAVKVLSPQLAADPTARQRFEREAQAAAALSHPNVVPVYRVGALADGTPYFVMQFVDGESMAARLVRDGPLPSDDARRILGQVASALGAAHAKGVVHRDIKPANILYDAESGRVLVSDFGIAAVRPPPHVPAPTPLTQAGALIGTLEYMSPEQLLAERVTEKSDIYSLGLLGYELLAGRGPFVTRSPGDLVAAHLRDRPKRLSEIRADIDPELESTLAACLAKDPADRPAAQEIAQRLTPGAAALLEWPPPGLERLLGKLAGQARALAVGSTLFAGAAVLFMTVGTRFAPAQGSLGTLVLWLLAIVGTALLLLHGGRLVRLGRTASRGAAAGFGWLTIVEVLADARGDTGALIAGTREYATLEPADRSRLRRNRAAVSLAMVVAALLPAPLFGIMLWLGSRGVAQPGAVPFVVLAPSLLLMLIARRLALRESRALRATRYALGRRRARGVSTPRLVQPWYESFEATRRGQGLGGGAQGRPASGWVVAVAVSAVVAGAALAAMPVLMVGALGPMVWETVLPPLLGEASGSAEDGRATDRLRLAESARRYRLATDTGVSLQDAGRAFRVLNGTAPQGRFRGLPVAPVLPPWAPRADDDPFHVMDGELPRLSQSIWLRIDQGLTTPERAWLERFAAHPAFGEVAVLARAGAIDLIGARVELPFPDDVTALDVPIPEAVVLKEVAFAQTVRAAWLSAQGRTAMADTALREIVSFGFLLMDNAATSFDELLGTVLVGIGRGGLERLYRALGKPEARAIRAAVDSTYAVVEQLMIERRRRPGWSGDIAALRRQLVDGLNDSTAARGTRWQYVLAAGLAPCTNVRELVFGPDPDIARALALARPALVRYPSDAELFRMMRETPQRFHADMVADGFPRMVFRASRLAGAMTGNDRLAGCVGVLLSRGVYF